VKILAEHGKDELAKVYVGELSDGHQVEFVESLQPPRPREEKWVNIVSTLVGCPVGCGMCDAGGEYKRPLTAGEMAGQVLHLARSRFPEGQVTSRMWKIQLARMGEPTLNRAVLDFLRGLAKENHENLVISLSTVAPRGCEPFIRELKSIKDSSFPGRFQLQFSLHSTSPDARRELIPVSTLSCEEIAVLGSDFKSPEDKKVTLNFVVIKGVPIDAGLVARLFKPDDFLIKITPLNPTERGRRHRLSAGFDPARPETAGALIAGFESKGFETILSIGELEENRIGSNCGQYINNGPGLNNP
jgi:23S rRNA (adenine2503-C2)-methyltransferase